jgi:hypothetical protein
MGMSEDETAGFVIALLEESSSTINWPKRPDWYKKNIGAKVRNWWRKAYKRPELSPDDLAFIEVQDISKWDKAFLRAALTFILNYKTDEGTVFISARQFKKFKGAGRGSRYRDKLGLLYKLKILELERTFPKRERSRLANVYRVLYDFKEETHHTE